MIRRISAEVLGVGLLMFVVVGSGLSLQPMDASGLLAHALVVGAALGAVVALLAPVSGAHLNPAVSLALWQRGFMPGRDMASYVFAQILGAVVGVIAAHATFGHRLLVLSTHTRDGLGLALSELIGTFVLVLLVLGLVMTDRASLVPVAVAAWIAVLIAGTASSGFANPAVTLSRSLTDTFTGIAPRSVPAFLLAQGLGGLLAAPTASLLFQPVRAIEQNLEGVDS